MGSKIPAGASDGSVNWIRLDNLPVMGRVVVISRHAGVASSYDCCTCVCPSGFTGVSTSPGSATMIPGQTTQFTCTCEYTNCNGSITFSNQTSGALWSSSNTAVATVSLGLVKAVAVGTAGIKASFTDWFTDASCQRVHQTYSSSSSCNVQKPTSLQLVATTSQGAATCSGGSAGWFRWVTWQVLDHNGQPIKFQMSVSDKIAIGGTNTCGASAQTGSITTDAYGQFPDHYFVCSTGCVGGKTCETDASQTYTVDGVVLSLDIKSIVYKCTSITINGQ